jgi:phytanoyl-CoA hydroxylase
VCIDDADEENGGLMFVPGSHRNDVLCHGDSDPSISFSKNTVPIPEGLARVQSELKAGDVVFFHGSMVHGSMPNRSTDRFRRSLILHYVPRASSQVAEWYLPLIDPRDAGETRIAAAPLGGPCGEAWTADEGAYTAAAAAAAA